MSRSTYRSKKAQTQVSRLLNDLYAAEHRLKVLVPLAPDMADVIPQIQRTIRLALRQLSVLSGGRQPRIINLGSNSRYDRAQEP